MSLLWNWDAFEPSNRVYQSVAADQVNENYVPRVLTFTISGKVGAPGVAMRGLPGEPVTDPQGVYRTQVEYGWSGTITPTREGFLFEPASKSFMKVTEDCANQDYKATPIVFTISGNVGLAGVTIRGFPGEIVTDESGAYQAMVPYGWTGKVTPAKTGYLFEPASRTYSKVTAPGDGQDFTPKAVMLTISDTIRMSNNEPVAEVKVTAEPGGQSVLTDSQGRFTIQVPYGWTGQLILSKPGLEFYPDRREYHYVTSNFIGGEDAPRGSGFWPAYPAPRPPTRLRRPVVPGAAGRVFVIPTGSVAPQRFAETADDLRIMLQILRDKLSEPRMVRGAFVDFGSFFDDESRACEAFYLQDSAAVFVLEMDLPLALVPPPQGGEAQEAADPVWQRARQRVYSPLDAQRLGTGRDLAETQKLDFQQFKQDLILTLRHAANIRNIEPNESVIVTIVAHDESSGWSAPARAGGSFSNKGNPPFEGGDYSTGNAGFDPYSSNRYTDPRISSTDSGSSPGGAQRPPAGPTSTSPTTVLTLQASKSDIDAFARSTLNFEQFQQRVKTFTY